MNSATGRRSLLRSRSRAEDPMRTRRRPARQLRTAIDCLPVDTRRAMLDGMDQNRIIVGAYTDRQGGVCPMLAAHRHGGRTALASFARAWDRYTGAGNGPRPASDRELRTLRTMLEASIAIESGGSQTELGTGHRRVPDLPRLPGAPRARAQAGHRRARPHEGAQARGRLVLAAALPPPGRVRARRRGARGGRSRRAGAASAERRLRYIWSPGRTNWISGTMHAGEVCSR